MSSESQFEAIKAEAKRTIKRVKKLQQGAGTYETPVDMDLVKTEKAMFFERVLEILRTGVKKLPICL